MSELDHLTLRQTMKRVTEMLRDGHTDREICELLGISPDMLRHFKVSIGSKFMEYLRKNRDRLIREHLEEIARIAEECRSDAEKTSSQYHKRGWLKVALKAEDTLRMLQKETGVYL